MIAKILSWFGLGVDKLVLKNVRKLLNKVLPFKGAATLIGLIVWAVGLWVLPHVPADYLDLANQVIAEICNAIGGKCDAVKTMTAPQLVVELGQVITGLGLFRKTLNHDPK